MSIQIWEGSPDCEDTTLIKPVPYDDMDKDEKDYILECIEETKARNPSWFDPESIYSEEYLQYELPACKLDGFDTGQIDTKVGPVFQVHSVQIFNDLPVWKGSKIYGCISLTDDRETNGPFSVYTRDVDDPEELLPDHNVLSLTDTPIAPLIRAKVAFSLFSASEDAHILSKFCFVDYESRDDDDYTKVQVKHILVQGKHGYYARMNYSVIPFALIADITMSLRLLKLPASVSNTLRIGGAINVNDFQLLKNNELKFSVNDSKQFIYEVELTRNVIAVPIPSVLSVDLLLTKDGDDFVTEMATIDPLSLKDTVWHCKCKDGEHYFFIYVSWISPDVYFGRLPKNPCPHADNFVEVFSIFIGGGGSTPASLRGSIVVRDRDNTVYIFSRNENCPYKLRWFRRTIALAWPDDRWILEKNFYMHLKIKDVHGNPVCRGGLSVYDSDWKPMRFDRRMCAIIPGENGYFAAVHYSIFPNGLRAKVTVTVDCETPCDLFDVYGVVYAEYNNYDYSSAYDKEYYRVIIFKRPVEERVRVQNSCKIPLSKSMIAAPSDCAELTFHVSICVRPFNDDARVSDTDLSAAGKIQFRAGINASQQISMFEIDSLVTRGVYKVKVEWVK